MPLGYDDYFKFVTRAMFFIVTSHLLLPYIVDLSSILIKYKQASRLLALIHFTAVIYCSEIILNLMEIRLD